MLQTEYIRNLHCNYERILLDKKPEERKYQYCILSRGGIKGLLPCSLRYINGLAYLYYDITSRQNAAQLYHGRTIGREWVKDLAWSIKRVHQELGRFLLDEKNVLWYPEQIYQDIEHNTFSFLYVPYYEGEESFVKLLEYLVERIDYEDEVLVECVYKMYEQWEKCGQDYLQEQFYEDIKMLEAPAAIPEQLEQPVVPQESGSGETMQAVPLDRKEPAEEKRMGIFSFLEGRKRRNQQAREEYQDIMRQTMTGQAVAEEMVYEEEYGRTIYIEETQEEKRSVHGLYYPDGTRLLLFTQEQTTFGKKKEEVDQVLEEPSVSRIHARITLEQGEYFLEDLNSTNGTFKNGLRLQTYEKRKLESEDEIRFGKVVLIYRRQKV